MSTASLLDSLYAQVDQIWSCSELTAINIDRLFLLVTQIRNVSGFAGIPLRASLPKSTKPEGLTEEHASKKKSHYTIDPDMDLDQLAQRMETVAKESKISFYYSCDVPEGQSVLKCSLASTRVCIANIEGIFVPSWQLVGTKETTKRMTEDLPLVMCKRIHRTIPEMQLCGFAHTLDKLQLLMDGGRTFGEVARQSAHLPPPESPKPPVLNDVPLTYTNTKGEQKAVTIDKVVQNKTAIEAMREGRGRQCAKPEPHSAVGCTFVHPIGSPTTMLVVSHRLYKVSDLEKNLGRDNLVTTTYKAGTKCARQEQHDVAMCKYIHIKEGAVPAPESDHSCSSTSLPEADASREKKNREAETVVTAAKKE